MKNCKKLTALILSVMMIFSTLCFAAGAENPAQTQESESSTTMNPSASELTYVTDPITTTTEKNIVEDLDPTLREDLTEIGDNLREQVSLFRTLFEKIQGFLQILIDFCKQLSDEIFNR